MDDMTRLVGVSADGLVLSLQVHADGTVEIRWWPTLLGDAKASVVHFGATEASMVIEAFRRYLSAETDADTSEVSAEVGEVRSGDDEASATEVQVPMGG